MIQCNSLNAKLSNSELNNLKSGIANVTKVTLNFSSNVISHSNNETNFSPYLLLTDTQVSRFPKAFANNSSANIKSSKTQPFKTIQLGRDQHSGLHLNF